MAQSHRICKVCGEYEVDASTSYIHQYTNEIPLGSQYYQRCQPKRPPGNRNCWNCNIPESMGRNDHWTRHDFNGRGDYTCLAPAPAGTQRCSNCHGLLPADDMWGHYHDFDQGGYYKCTARHQK